MPFFSLSSITSCIFNKICWLYQISSIFCWIVSKSSSRISNEAQVQFSRLTKRCKCFILNESWQFRCPSFCITKKNCKDEYVNANANANWFLEILQIKLHERFTMQGRYWKFAVFCFCFFFHWNCLKENNVSVHFPIMNILLCSYRTFAHSF